MSRAQRASWASKTWAFVRRDVLFETSYKLQFLYRIGAVLFQIATFYFLSGFMSREATATHLGRYGSDYFSFALVGIAFLGFLDVGTFTYTTSIRQLMTLGVLEPMLVTRTRPATILVNSLLWPFGFELLRAVFYLIVGCALLGAHVDARGFPAAIVALVLALTIYGALGLVSAGLLIVLKQGDPVGWFLAALSGLLGGAYFPVSILPPWLQTVSAILPITHVLDTLRLALLAGRTLPEMLPQIGILALFAAITVPLALVAVTRSFEIAKRRGGLGSY